MKKLILILTLAVSTLFASGQLCQPSFSWQTGANNEVYFMGFADSLNSPADSVTSWMWTFNGGGASYTASTQSPMMVLNSNTSYDVCLTINTSSGCSGTFCDSVYFDNCTVYVSIQGTHPTAGQCNGSATATASAGTPPYTYLWNNGMQTTASITNLCPGTYTVMTTDFNGCIAQASITLIDSTSTGCYADFTYIDNGNGSFQFNAYNDSVNPIASYNWSFNGGTPATSTMQNPFVVYNTSNFVSDICLTVTTLNGQTCTYCDSIYIDSTNPCTLTATLDITPVSVIGGNDGAIDVTVSGGTPPYTYLWNTSETTEDISGLTSGSYSLNVYDSNPACPNGMYYTAYIYEPYDTTNGNNIVDTLYSPIIDTCLNFVPDSFYISQINVINNNFIVVTWIFTYAGQTQTLDITYEFSVIGNQLVVLTIDCGTKVLTTFSSYIHISQAMGITSLSKVMFEVYPNPAGEMFRINAKAPYTFSVTDLSGRLIVAGQSDMDVTGIYSANLPEGMYIIKVKQGDTVNMKKVIVKK